MTKGSYEISDSLLKTITANLSTSSCILELGSGVGTSYLISLGYEVYSVEQNVDWVGKYHDNYCHAPIKNGWYDMEVVNDFVNGLKYDAILIDGPAAGDRLKMLDSDINFETLIFVDDIDRPVDRKLFDILKKGRKYEDMKLYGVIHAL